MNGLESVYTFRMGALPATKISVEDYLALDREAEVPSEYHDGEMFPLEMVTMAHAAISLSIGSLLRERLAKTACRAFPSPLRVRASPTKYLIPDLMVVCGKPALSDEHHETVTNPKVIVEVLSPSTADYDYGEKFILYRKLESFEEYLLVSQNQARVEVAHKAPDKRWVITTYEGLDAVVIVESLGISLPMAEIYDGIEFSPMAA
jgi:Uma2 family endonuclease